MAELRAKNKFTLEWDYSADPTWVNGVNVCIEDAVRDEDKIKKIERWYDKFSKAEEKLHEEETGLGRKRVSDKELEKTIRMMKDKLVPEGRRLARDIGASLKVDWGHDKHVRKLVSKVFGRNIEEIQAY